ncbi:putative nuclease HARBI1 [Uloborus diversus]|uniref:putative nuclease HARBI1 n=1 Tax=Uloborus diversus TaxID=327109 RepID=UPI0024096E2E|nr:putative nuclease HARBI1 [Uloborus diversus]
MRLTVERGIERLVLAALRFYGTGSYQGSVAGDEYIRLSQKSVSRCIHDVSSAISSEVMPRQIRFPSTEEQEQIKRRVYLKHNFPGVIGTIDCTHVRIVAPAEDSTEIRQMSFFSRKCFHSLNVQLVLCALNFFPGGGYQKRVGNDDYIKVTQQSASNCIRQVSQTMSQHLLRKFVQYPSDQRAQENIKEEFFNYCGIGGVLGAIDCTHVAIIGPPNDGFHQERNYVNRKGWHSLNVQLICDMDTKILNVVARAPGCTHDSFIWRSSNLKTAFDEGNKIHGDGWLLGDAGYRQERHLHVPIEGAIPGSDEYKYNAAHAKGRCVIERCNGILKNRFRCLLKDRVLHYLPEVAAHITNSCVILHNMCVEDNIYWEDAVLDEEDELFDTVEDDDE